MNTEIKVLDHGFVKLRNISGPTRRIYDDMESLEDREVKEIDFENCREFDADDTDPANCARMSFDQTDSSRTREQDLKLLEYLIKNEHWTPIEMIEVWLEFKLPIFVARQFVRHRACTLNEVSGRYVTLPAEWYIPEIVGGKAANKKQGQENNLDEYCQNKFKDELNTHCRRGYATYLTALNNGVAPEHARMLLSLNHYTHWIMKIDLRNLFNFLKLRDHSHAQIEAQLYAKAIDKLLRQVIPENMKLYDKYCKQSQ